MANGSPALQPAPHGARLAEMIRMIVPMSTPASLAQMYEDLANHFARQGESRQRDQCLVLAADAALTAGMPLEAERLRKRLLLTNPNHLLRPYATMSEA